MSLNLKWTKRAQRSFDNIYEYIELSFGEKIANKFVSESFEIFNLLCLHPKMGTLEESDKMIYGFVLSEQTTLFYRSDNANLVLLNFYNNRKNPKKRSKFYK